MNKKELGEIRRRIRPEHNNIQKIYGYYVNSKKQIIARVEESPDLLNQQEQEKYFSLLRKTLSGSIGRNLMELRFTTAQVAEGAEHSMLEAVRRSELKDSVLREEFCSRILGTLGESDTNWLILLAYDVYDVPRKNRGNEWQDESEDLYRAILCGVYPVKEANPVFCFRQEENRFGNLPLSQIVSPPELGFLYPAFDDRRENIYSALFYTRDLKEINHDFIDTLFHTNAPLSAKQQKESFSAVLKDSLQSNCSFEMVQAVQEKLREMVIVHKESQDPETLLFSSDDITAAIEECGGDDENCSAFMENYARIIGDQNDLAPENIVNMRRSEIETSSVKITADPAFATLIRMDEIDGKPYILIPADGTVELNGIPVNI